MDCPSAQTLGEMVEANIQANISRLKREEQERQAAIKRRVDELYLNLLCKIKNVIQELPKIIENKNLMTKEWEFIFSVQLNSDAGDDRFYRSVYFMGRFENEDSFPGFELSHVGSTAGWGWRWKLKW